MVVLLLHEMVVQLLLLLQVVVVHGHLVMVLLLAVRMLHVIRPHGGSQLRWMQRESILRWRRLDLLWRRRLKLLWGGLLFLPLLLWRRPQSLLSLWLWLLLWFRSLPSPPRLLIVLRFHPGRGTLPARRTARTKVARKNLNLQEKYLHDAW